MKGWDGRKGDTKGNIFLCYCNGPSDAMKIIDEEEVSD